MGIVERLFHHPEHKSGRRLTLRQKVLSALLAVTIPLGGLVLSGCSKKKENEKKSVHPSSTSSTIKPPAKPPLKSPSATIPAELATPTPRVLMSHNLEQAVKFHARDTILDANGETSLEVKKVIFGKYAVLLLSTPTTEGIIKSVGLVKKEPNQALYTQELPLMDDLITFINQQGSSFSYVTSIDFPNNQENEFDLSLVVYQEGKFHEAKVHVTIDQSGKASFSSFHEKPTSIAIQQPISTPVPSVNQEQPNGHKLKEVKIDWFDVEVPQEVNPELIHSTRGPSLPFLDVHSSNRVYIIGDKNRLYGLGFITHDQEGREEETALSFKPETREILKEIKPITYAYAAYQGDVILGYRDKKGGEQLIRVNRKSLQLEKIHFNQATLKKLGIDLKVDSAFGPMIIPLPDGRIAIFYLPTHQSDRAYLENTYDWYRAQVAPHIAIFTKSGRLLKLVNDAAATLESNGQLERPETLTQKGGWEKIRLAEAIKPIKFLDVSRRGDVLLLKYVDKENHDYLGGLSLPFEQKLIIVHPDGSQTIVNFNPAVGVNITDENGRSMPLTTAFKKLKTADPYDPKALKRLGIEAYYQQFYDDNGQLRQDRIADLPIFLAPFPPDYYIEDDHLLILEGPSFPGNFSTFTLFGRRPPIVRVTIDLITGKVVHKQVMTP